VQNIIAKPEIGEAKVGDLAGISVYKFSMVKQQTLLAYQYEEQTITLLTENLKADSLSPLHMLVRQSLLARQEIDLSKWFGNSITQLRIHFSTKLSSLLGYLKNATPHSHTISACRAAVCF